MVEALHAVKTLREYSQNHAGFQTVDRPLRHTIHAKWVTWADHAYYDRIHHHLGDVDPKKEKDAIAELFADDTVFEMYENIAHRHIIREVLGVTGVYTALTRPDAFAVADLCVSFSQIHVGDWFGEAQLYSAGVRTLPTSRVLILNAVKRALRVSE